MWSFFSRDPTKDFAFDIGEPVSGLEEKSIWQLHYGKKKANGEEVSIFVCDLKNSSELQADLAKSSFKRIKTLRHPNILTYLDGLETEKVLYVVTEAVIPLDNHLRDVDNQPGKNLAISWGLHQLVKALSFLINDCNLIHNNVCMPAIFVNKAGEWKLGGLDYVSPVNSNSSPPRKILPLLEKYDPPEKSGSTAGRRGEKWSTDMWGLGCLIWEVFNGNLTKTSGLKSLGKIPKNLVPHYCELVGANPRVRPNPAKFLDSCRAQGGFMDNKFVNTMLFLEEIQIKEQNEKTKFFNSLSPVLDTFPPDFCKHKILPQLVHAYEFGNAGSAVLGPLFKLGKLLDTEEYQQKIIPCVVKLFSSTDRATRVKLLQQMEQFVEYLNTDVVNKQIFPSVAQGFMDTVPLVREQTLKAILHLAPKLNYKNLNEEVLKHFARLQAKDDQGGIRCNTTVCLGKIAGHLNPQMRQKVLSSAYLRAFKDPFPPARQAGILAMAATHNFFTLRESATRLLPALCSMTMDPDKGCRDQAFKTIKCFLGKLEKVSEDPELTEEMEKDVNVGGTGSMVTSAASWAGWAVSGVASVTSKIYKGKRPSSAEKGKDIHGLPVDGSDKQESNTSKARVTSAGTDKEQAEPEAEPAAGGGWDDDTEGWDDDQWGDMEDTSNMASRDEASNPTDKEQEEDPGGGWDVDDDDDAGWGSIEDTTPAIDKNNKGASSWDQSDFTETNDQDTSSASTYNWGQDVGGDDFFSSVMTNEKKPKSRILSSHTTKKQTKSPSVQPASSRSASSHTSTTNTAPVSASTVSSGDSWGEVGWDNDDWTATPAQQGLSPAEIAKKEREEKRLQRQKEIQEKRAARQAGGGAMKLGAKKLT